MTDPTTIEILDIIERNAHSASAVIARIQEPLREIEAQDVNINSVLGAVVSGLAERWRVGHEKGMINVELSLDDSIPQIRAPIGQISEVFCNLMDNACRAMKGLGQLTITSELTVNIIHVRIQDTGPGISPEIRERLFVKPVSSKEQSEGAGLGLWLNRLILQSLTGDVTIEKTDSSGTTMLVEIPAEV
jgi:signal transduction histidine kinase